MQEGSGEIIARLLNPGGTVVSEETWTIAVVGVAILRDGANIGIAKQTVWVGEKINLELVGVDAAIVVWWGLNHAIKTYIATDSFGKVFPLTAGDKAGKHISFHWVQGGSELVSVTFARLDPRFPARDTFRIARFDVKRPAANVTSETSSVFTFVGPEGSAEAQFGNIEDPAVPAAMKVPGIEFTKVPDPAALATGEYKWVQLVDTSDHYEKDDGTRRRSVSGEFVLDSSYPYGEPNDSPAAYLGPEVRSRTLDDSFQMYLMWNPGTAGAIDVPLRVTPWFWGFAAVESPGAPGNINGFVFGTYYSPNPASQNTIEFPVWTKNIAEIGYEDDN
jgi:hypothetical protein